MMSYYRILHKVTQEELFDGEFGSLKDCLAAAIGKNVNLTEANLSGANLSDVDLSGANLSDVDLYGANLCGANLSRANLYAANLCGANLFRANLSRANLYAANLSDASLSDANLSDVDLSGANLSQQIDQIKHSLNLLRSQPGVLNAYKVVNRRNEGIYQGGIQYLTGASYEVLEADTDERNACGAGINVATLEWCLKEKKSNHHILILEFRASDIAAIPYTSNGKFRLFRCKVVGTYEEENTHE
jgi:uncharacterized protein YjbI with pentapeptide repeats